MNNVSNVKALVGTFNQEKAVVAAVIVKSSRTFVESSTVEVEADIRNMYLLRFLRPKYSCLCFGAHLLCCGRCGRQEEAGQAPVLGGSINS